TLRIFYVKDNGLGIPEIAMPRLFSAFQRLHGNVAAGEGIGLALVRRMVERHGGRVWAESTEGVGTTFYVSLPDAAAPSHDDEHDTATT
ncbi:ATP-binding protein, partial [Paraburkholderia sp. SIMBA_050]